MLLADDQRLAQIITNLLGNAIKFTPAKGTIVINAALTGESDGVYTLRIEVRDTGIGISPEQQSRLFNAFEQAEASTARKYGGTGLGLVISKSIVEMMEGAIWLDSEPGKGTTFSCTVRLMRGRGEQEAFVSPKVPLENMRILAVDDDPDVLVFFREAAKSMGIVCDTALSGPAALSQIKENGMYNIYFVDWSMPGMNGIELARNIGEMGAEHTVIMISASDWSMLQEEARAAGVRKFIPKPLFMSSIAACINELLSTPEPANDAAAAESAADFAGCRILLAEDVEINREIVLALLEPTHLQIDCAVNGAEAVDMFLAAPEKYGMIFMDVQMPEMDGFTATRTIRESAAPRGKEIPIIAMTANVFKEDIERCLASGMDGHIGKPLVMDEVIDCLKKYLNNR